MIASAADEQVIQTVCAVVDFTSYTHFKVHKESPLINWTRHGQQPMKTRIFCGAQDMYLLQHAKISLTDTLCILHPHLWNPWWVQF